MKVNIKLINENATVPEYALPGDAGLDLVATSKQINRFGQAVFGFGLSIEIPDGYMGLIFPRSSIQKTNSRMSNAVGVIDSQFRGELSAIMDQMDIGTEYRVGDRVAQLIILPYPKIELHIVNELSETKRGSNGHGSTGTQIFLFQGFKLNKKLKQVLEEVKNLKEENKQLKGKNSHNKQKKEQKQTQGIEACPRCHTGKVEHFDWGPMTGYLCDTCTYRGASPKRNEKKNWKNKKESKED